MNLTDPENIQVSLKNITFTQKISLHFPGESISTKVFFLNPCLPGGNFIDLLPATKIFLRLA
jgi:hypothetical protein